LIGVVIVDDHRVVRRGLRAYLESTDDLEVLGEAADGIAALELVEKLVTLGSSPEVVLTDLVMDRMDGEQLTRELLRRFPGVRVVVMTSFSDLGRIKSLIADGASGYVLKDADSDQVAAALRAANAGQVHLDPEVARVLTQSMVNPVVMPLTDREQQVVSLVARGLSNHQIADRLVMSERTARTHLSNVFAKLGLQSRTQVALWAIRAGLASSDQ
jgi:DNA-binding NarL/FixJ family response regulator